MKNLTERVNKWLDNEDNFKVVCNYFSQTFSQKMFRETHHITTKTMTFLRFSKKEKKAFGIVLKTGMKTTMLKSETYDDFINNISYEETEYEKGWHKIGDHLVVDGDQMPLIRFIEATDYLIGISKNSKEPIQYSDPNSFFKIEVKKINGKRLLSLSYVFDNRYLYEKEIPDYEMDILDFALWLVDDTSYQTTPLYTAPIAPDTVELFALIVSQTNKNSKIIAQEIGFSTQTLSKILNRKMVPKSIKLREAISKFTKGAIPIDARW